MLIPIFFSAFFPRVYLVSNSSEPEPDGPLVLSAGISRHQFLFDYPLHENKFVSKCIVDTFYTDTLTIDQDNSIKYNAKQFMVQLAILETSMSKMKNHSFSCPFPIRLIDWYWGLSHELTHLTSVNDLVSNYSVEIWTCLIPEQYMCDGISSCLTDECSCEEDRSAAEKHGDSNEGVLFCAEQPGCIAFSQVCITYVLRI